MVETVKRLERGELTVSEPRHAATVILLRERAGGPEVYLLRRTASMAFAAGFFVFPGGSVDPRDESFSTEAWVGPGPADWAQRLACDEPTARALVCAAVRETFEESGVLLAGENADSVVADTSDARWEAERLALIDRSLSLAQLLHSRGLVLRADLLRLWSHWITPEVEPKRFDTRFFVALLPAGQRTRDVGGEADRVAWLRPADALAAQASGEMSMLPPTLASLSDLASCATGAEVMAAAERRHIAAVLPKLTLDAEDRIRFLLPEDPDYPKGPPG